MHRWREALLVSALLACCATCRARDAADLIKEAGTEGGLVVHLGCGDGSLTAALRVSESHLVHGLDTTAERVDAARAQLREQGIYGPVSIDLWDGSHLPYADSLVNVIIASDAAKAEDPELLRVLTPNGIALIREGASWRKLVKPWPEGMDEWTHYLHAADGNPVADDRFVASPTRLQWVGNPRWARHHDHMASMTSLVSAGGRLFYILDEGPTESIQLPPRWRLIARDAFNGVVLWKREIAQWNTHQYPLKSGPAHLLRRLVAMENRVYCTLGIDAPVSALDAATGKTVHIFEGSRFAREIVAAGGVLHLVADTSRSTLPDWRREDTYVWDNTRRANVEWGWNGRARKIIAYRADTAEPLWQTDTPVAPCSLAVGAGRAVFHDGRRLVCLDGKTGKVLWQGEDAPTKLPVQSNTGPRVLVYEDVVLLGANDGKMSGWSLDTGKKLWEERHRPSGHQSLKDLFVVGGLAWTGAIAGSSDDGAFVGYDPRTGEVKQQFPADVQVHWFHHRCYPSKAAGKYLITARNGTEYLDTEQKTWKPNHWFRGGCIYGVMPCNGMTYASMSACGCQLEAKLTGFNALASGPIPAESSAPRLLKGRVQNRVSDLKPQTSDQDDWPTYRHDAGRSGATATQVGATLGRAWHTQIGGRLTPPVIANGKLLTASIDTHTVYALDARTGKTAWTFTAGGRVDSAPTCYSDLVLFGSADGYVYALHASDGVMAWRFRAAPVDRRLIAWEQLESAWPVHGSVLIHDGTLYCTAGRNMFLDGGIRFLRLNPMTGELIGETVMNDRDPDTGEDMQLTYLKKTQGNNMPVALSDVLSCDGRHIWMRSQKFALDGTRREIALEAVEKQTPEDFHLFCQVGFLDDSYFFRSYWTYGRRVTGGYGGWYQAGRLVPAGRILCYDDQHVYGYGRKPEYMVNASVLEYQLFAADKTVTAEAIAAVKRQERAMNARLDKKNANSSDWRLRYFYPREDLTAARFAWTVDQPGLLARAMAVARDTLFVAGPPDVIDERQAYHLPDDKGVQAQLRLQAEALDGRHGAQLWALAKRDGAVLKRYELEGVPVFDGMAAAQGHLYMCTQGGRVVCLSADVTPLPSADSSPIQVAWNKPEDPGYLRPPVASCDSDFAEIVRCKAFKAELGYRLRANDRKVVGLALKKLEKPITGAATFKTLIRSVPGETGLLRNGYLAFGEGADEAGLVKCGVRLRNQHASIIQGPLASGKGKGTAVEVQDEKGVVVIVTVNLETGSVTCVANGRTIETRLAYPLKRITHVGYVFDSALIDVAPVEITVIR